MCHQPVRRTMDFVRAAEQRISEGKFVEAARLLKLAKTNIGSGISNRINGQAVGYWIGRAEQKLRCNGVKATVQRL